MKWKNFKLVRIEVNHDLIIRDLVESGIKNNKLPEDLVISERAMKALNIQLNNLIIMGADEETFYGVAKGFLRGYAEGKYESIH